MPNTEPMTQTEMTRAVNRIENMVGRVEVKLDKMPDWEDIKRQEDRRDAEQRKQDEAITAVEGKVTALMMAVIAAALGSVVSLISSLGGA